MTYGHNNGKQRYYNVAPETKKLIENAEQKL